MGQFQAFSFCLVIGFVAAGTIASFYQLVTSERADFFASRETRIGWVIAVVLIMFGGPAIVARRIWQGIASRQMSPSVAAAGTVFAGMWSVVAGIFFVSLMIGV